MYRFTPYLEKIVANDIQALQTLYGTLNLPFPTNGWMTLRNHPPYYVVEDNKDGTLETIQYKETTWLLGTISKERLPTGYIIKKCIQGQVYRAEQNDCKGKGTAADWWK